MQSINFHTHRGWMNDPNGFIYYKGEYHLFYQYFPHATQWGTICWGHAVSPDLVNWQQEDIALFPSKPADQNGCFSGSAIESGGRLRLFYTGVHYDEFDPDDINKCIPGHFTSAQLTIESPDGRSFNNFEDKRVIIPPIEDPELGDATHTRRYGRVPMAGTWSWAATSTAGRERSSFTGARTSSTGSTSTAPSSIPSLAGCASAPTSLGSTGAPCSSPR